MGLRKFVIYPTVTLFFPSFVAVSFMDYIGWYYYVPVVLPPPKFVLNPNANTRSAVHLYIFASFSRISVFATVAWNN